MKRIALSQILLLLASLLVGCETFSEQYCQVRVVNRTSSPMKNIVMSTRIDYHMDPNNKEEETTTRIGDLDPNEASRGFRIKCSKRTSSIFSPGYSLTDLVSLSFSGKNDSSITVYDSSKHVITSSLIGSIERNMALFLEQDEIEISIDDNGASVRRTN